MGKFLKHVCYSTDAEEHFYTELQKFAFSRNKNVIYQKRLSQARTSLDNYINLLQKTTKTTLEGWQKTMIKEFLSRTINSSKTSTQKAMAICGATILKNQWVTLKMSLHSKEVITSLPFTLAEWIRARAAKSPVKTKDFTNEIPFESASKMLKLKLGLSDTDIKNPKKIVALSLNNENIQQLMSDDPESKLSGFMGYLSEIAPTDNGIAGYLQSAQMLFPVMGRALQEGLALGTGITKEFGGLQDLSKQDQSLASALGISQSVFGAAQYLVPILGTTTILSSLSGQVLENGIKNTASELATAIYKSAFVLESGISDEERFNRALTLFFVALGVAGGVRGIKNAGGIKAVIKNAPEMLSTKYKISVEASKSLLNEVKTKLTQLNEATKRPANPQLSVQRGTANLPGGKKFRRPQKPTSDKIPEPEVKPKSETTPQSFNKTRSKPLPIRQSLRQWKAWAEARRAKIQARIEQKIAQEGIKDVGVETEIVEGYEENGKVIIDEPASSTKTENELKLEKENAELKSENKKLQNDKARAKKKFWIKITFKGILAVSALAFLRKAGIDNAYLTVEPDRSYPENQDVTVATPIVQPFMPADSATLDKYTIICNWVKKNRGRFNSFEAAAAAAEKEGFQEFNLWFGSAWERCK